MIFKPFSFLFVGIPGLEPGMTGPESVVHFSEPSKLFGTFFHKKQRNLKIDFAL